MFDFYSYITASICSIQLVFLERWKSALAFCEYIKQNKATVIHPMDHCFLKIINHLSRVLFWLITSHDRLNLTNRQLRLFDAFVNLRPGF